MKPSFGDAKHVKDKLERLSKDYTEKGNEKASPKAIKAKEKRDKGEGKTEEPQKKRKLFYNRGSVYANHPSSKVDGHLDEGCES